MFESTYDASIANPTASDNGTKSDRATPIMKNDGTKTARIESMASSLRPDGLAAGAQDGCRLGLTRRQMRVNVLDRDRRLVDQNADRERQAARVS